MAILNPPEHEKSEIEYVASLSPEKQHQYLQEKMSAKDHIRVLKQKERDEVAYLSSMLKNYSAPGINAPQGMGPVAPSIYGAFLNQNQPVPAAPVPAVAGPGMAPVGLPLMGPMAAAPMALAKASPKMSREDAQKMQDAINQAQAPKAAPLTMADLPSFSIKDLLPDQGEINAALENRPIDIRPIAALMDSIYGTDTASKMKDLPAEHMRQLKEKQALQGYSPALQQVIGQARLKEYEAKLDKVTGAEDKEFERWYKKQQLADKDLDRDQAQRQWAATYNLDRMKVLGDLGLGNAKRGVTTTDSGKPMNNDQTKAQGSLSLMNDSSALIDNYAARPGFDPMNVARVVSRINIYKGVKQAPFIGGLVSPIAEAGISGIGDSGGALQQLSEEERLYLNEARNFIAGKLRKESGAAISDTEFEKEWDRFFPVAGDTPATLEAKRKARNRETIARRFETGKTDQFVYGEEK